jgi:hypothetical protein
VQVAYGSNGNTDFNSPSAGNWTAGATIAAGKQVVMTGDTRSIFVRPNTNGETIRFGVYSETGEH